jgi:V/A-type H+-transporting ATPase subunit E
MTVEETNIQALLDRIKREGVEKAEQEARDIVDRARAEANRLIEQAQKESARLVAEAEEEVRRKQGAFESKMSQAGRDLVLGVKQQIIGLMQRILEREVKHTLTPDFLREVITEVIKRWQTQDTPEEGSEILLSENDLERLDEAFVAGLQKELRGGVTLRPVKAVEAGFRIGERDGALHYDFSDRGIAEMLSAYLNPRVAKFLKEDAGGGRAAVE